MTAPSTIAELNRVKALFQLRAIAAAMGLPFLPASAQLPADATYPGRGHSTSPRTSSDETA